MNQQPEHGESAAPMLGLFFCLIAAPAFCSTFFRDIFTLPKALPLAFGVALLWACAASRRSFRPERSSLTPAIKAMSAAVILSALFSADTPLSVLGHHQQQFYAILPLALVLLAFHAAASQDDIPPIVFVLLAVAGGAVAAVPAFLQVFGHFMIWSVQGGRSGGTFGSPIYLGGHLAMILPLAWSLTRRGGMSPAAKMIARAAFVLVLAGLLAAKSRGAVIAGASGIILVEYLLGRKRTAFFIGVVGVVVLSVVMALRAENSHGSDVARIEIWLISLRAWLAHPLMGWGPDTFPLAFRQFMTQRFVEANGSDLFIQNSAHNDLLQVLTTLGLIGFCAYALLIKESVRLLRSRIGREDGAIGIAGALLAVFVQAKLNPITLTSMVTAALLLGALDRRSEPAPPRSPYPGVASACLLVVIFSVMLTAERYQRLGENLNQMGRGVEAAEQFNRAAQVNPFTLYYSQRQLDYFWQVLPRVPGVNKRQLAEFSHSVSEHIGRLHPLDPTARELRGMSYEFEGKMLGVSRDWEADHEFAVAERLAPRFSAYAKRRKALAQKSKRRK